MFICCFIKKKYYDIQTKNLILIEHLNCQSLSDQPKHFLLISKLACSMYESWGKNRILMVTPNTLSILGGPTK